MITHLSQCGSKFFLLTCLLGISVFSSGCAEKLPPGMYQGTLAMSEVFNVKEFDEQSVQLSVSYLKNGTAFLSISAGDSKDVKAAENLQNVKGMMAYNFNHWGFDLIIENLRKEPFHLKSVKNIEESCYAADEGKHYIEVCFGDDYFELEVTENHNQQIVLTGTLNKESGNIAYEKSQILTVSDAIERAMSKNADNQQEQEKLIQAQEAARGAYLALLPRLNLNSILTTFTSVEAGNLSGAVGALGDFTPFLFPNRWKMAEQLRWQSQAEKMAGLLLKGNIAVAVHTLAINLLDHRAYYEDLKNYLALMKDALSHTKASKEVTNSLQLIVNELEAGTLAAEADTLTDSEKLSSILAYNNPEAIRNIFPGDALTPIDEVAIHDGDQLVAEKRNYARLAVSNSFQLRQQHYLIRAAGSAEDSLLVNWLDISLNPQEHLGADYISHRNTAVSGIRAIKDQKAQTRRDLIQNAFTTVRDRNRNILLLKIAKDSVERRKDTFMGLISQLAEASGEVNSASQDKLQDKLKDATDKLQGVVDKFKDATDSLISDLKTRYALHSTIQMAQALLKRMTLDGPYQALIPHLQKSDHAAGVTFSEEQVDAVIP